MLGMLGRMISFLPKKTWGMGHPQWGAAFRSDSRHRKSRGKRVASNADIEHAVEGAMFVIDAAGHFGRTAARMRAGAESIRNK